MNSDSTYRLPKVDHEWIDRERPISFQFEGREYTGFVGDSISSALWGNGLRMLGRSFKYLTASGLRTGLFSSPHLVSVRERFQIDGEAIEEPAFVGVVNHIRARAADLFDESTEYTPTYFEFVTAVAFEYFRQEAVDVAVVEVGMGGRLDSTNVVTPLVSVITSIGFDHTGPLGDSLREIAGEKAGIIKPGIPVVCGETEIEATSAIVAAAAACESPITRCGVDFSVKSTNSATDTARQQSCIEWRGSEFRLATRLLGRHQAANCATAFAALQILSDQGLSVDSAAAARGIEEAIWPGRFDRTSDGVIVDVAHNVSALSETLILLETYCHSGRQNLLFAVMQDKPWQEMLAAIVPRLETLTLVPINNDRAVPPDVIRQYVATMWPALGVDVVETVAAGLQLLRERGRGLVLGSAFLAGDVLAVYSGGAPVTPACPAGLSSVDYNDNLQADQRL